ncbi:flagellin [Zoogloeaceae bacteirum Par-f-2]|nr:flagellin [Rhodocyclaceae bacterium]AVZ79590.1 flagellin [Zoogloeaceae bacteirum Par-f-2]
MSAVINTNVASLNAQRNLAGTGNALATSLQRLSSGLRINSAKDDAAGLAISERFTAQIRGLDQARRNANDGVSLAQTGEGALNQMGNILQRVRELAVQSANATNSASDRAALNAEVTQLVAELERFANTTEFNGTRLFDGSNSSLVYQVGANANQTITATTTDFRTSQYGTYQIGNATQSTAVSGTSTGSAITGAAVASGGTVTINGAGGSATITTTTSDSARDIAAKINSQPTTGVRASARTETVLDFAASGNFSVQLFSSNAAGPGTIQTVSFTVSDANTADGLTQAVNAINEASSKTGITARLNSANNAILLSTDDGSSINIGAASTGAATAGIILGSGTTETLAANTSGTLTAAGQVTLDSSKSYSITTSSDAAFTAGVLGSGAVAVSTTVGSTLKKVQELDISTVSGATNALRVVDSALDAINGQRAKFGALQSRFEATVANLQTSVENLSASRSRIRDADFAAETAALTRAQVLQQAGTAMLAQANALPQNVLSLLRG